MNLHAPRLQLHGAIAGALLCLVPGILKAHCDTMDGPVVKAARQALETRDVNLVLVWVQHNDEPVIREAFEKTLEVRTASPAARELADMYFFETLVRIHRAGEGVAYTGLKPAGTPVEPGIEAAEEALHHKSADELLAHLHEAVRNGIGKRLSHTLEATPATSADVEAGRRYVAAYVEFIHYVEGLYRAAEQGSGEHLHEAVEPGVRHQEH